MAGQNKQAFAIELDILSRSLEQACKALSSLKYAYDAEMHCSVNEVATRAKQLRMDQPVMALPHQTMENDGCLSSDQGSTNTKIGQYLQKVDAGVPHHDSKDCRVVPLADAMCEASEAKADSKALVVPTTGINAQASELASSTHSAMAPEPQRDQSKALNVGIHLDGSVREFWRGAKQESVDRLTSRCTVQVRRHDSDHDLEQDHLSTHQMVLASRALDAGAEIASKAVCVGQGLYDVAFCMLSPVGTTRFVWNVLCLLFVTYDLFLVPMQAFEIENNEALQAIEWILTIWWTLDVYITFRTGYIDGARMEMRPAKVAVRYACTWLLCDAVIVIVEWINRFARAFSSASVMRSQRILRFFRILKLLRLGKASSFWRTLQEQVNSNATILLITMALMTGALILCLHVTACIWYAIGESSDDGWTTKDEYRGEKDDMFWYFASIRWVIAQFNGRTDTDDTRNMLERLFTCVCGLLLAIIAQATFVSLITKTLFDLSEVVSEKTRRRCLVNEYLEGNPLSPMLTSQVKRCLKDYQDVDKEIRKEDQVLAILPNHLQTDVLEEVRSPVLMQHPFFQAVPFESPGVMRLICCDVVQTLSAIKDEKVFDKGDICERMLFTDRVTAFYGNPFDSSSSQTNAGTVARFPSSSEPQKMHSKLSPSKYDALDLLDCMGDRQIKAVKKGSWISEAALWVEWRNQGRLVCTTHGIMLAVSASTLADGLKKHHPDALPLAYVHGKHVALELSKQDPGEVSDILTFEIELYSPLIVMVTVVSAAGLRNADGVFTGKSDPYCKCNVVGVSGRLGEMCFQTRTIDNTLDPVWNHSAEVLVSRHQMIEFAIFDSDYGKQDEELGLARLRPEDFANGFEGDLPLQASDGAPAQGYVRVSLRVLDKEPEAHGMWQQAQKKKKKLRRGLSKRGQSNLSLG